MDSGRTLAVHMYNLLNEGLAREAAYATAVVLLVLVVGINALSSFVAKTVHRGKAKNDMGVAFDKYGTCRPAMTQEWMVSLMD